MSLYELLIACAAITAALATIGGGIFWLVWPRIEDRFQEVARTVERVDRQMTDQPGTLGGHAKRAADELPAIRQQVTDLADTTANLAKWRDETDRRLVSLEGTLIALLGPELRRRFADPQDVTR